jgi:hypothetical protein
MCIIVHEYVWYMLCIIDTSTHHIICSKVYTIKQSTAQNCVLSLNHWSHHTIYWRYKTHSLWIHYRAAKYYPAIFSGLTLLTNSDTLDRFPLSVWRSDWGFHLKSWYCCLHIVETASWDQSLQDTLPRATSPRAIGSSYEMSFRHQRSTDRQVTSLIVQSLE